MVRFASFCLAAVHSCANRVPDSDVSTLLQLHMSNQNSAPEKQQRATKLLAEVKTMVTTMKRTEQDPVRQCQGGWRTGSGVGDSEQSLGQAASQDACITMVREQCSGANGATYESASGSCICEIGQTELDASATQSENCAFFADDTTDEDLSGAVGVLNDLVDSILDAMQAEHDSSQSILNTAFSGLGTALDLTNTHSAEEVDNLRDAAREAAAASEQCASELESWTTTQADDCQSWENLATALSGSCSEACPCATNSATFFDAFEVWEAIVADSGAQIRSSQQACAEANGQVAQLEASCPNLVTESHAADQAYGDAHAIHLSTCSNFATGVENYQAIESEVRLELGQRNSEYDILQQVKCYINAIEGGVSGELVDGQCPATEHDHFSIDFQTIPDSPTCLQADGDVSVVVTPFDFAGATCSAVPPQNCNHNCQNCVTSPAGQLHFNYYTPGNDWYWQVTTANPETFVRFSLSIQGDAAVPFSITYSDDGSTWSTAGEFQAVPNPDVTWTEVGAHRYWRYNPLSNAGHGRWYVDLKFYIASWDVDHPHPTRQYGNANAPGPWTLILQYGTEPYTPTSEAVGVPDEFETGFHKLSDEAINALSSVGYNYYWLTSEPNVGEDSRGQILVRLPASQAYDDTTPRPFDNAEFCLDAQSFESPDSCTEWHASWSSGYTNYQPNGNDCARWFQGYPDQPCFMTASADRCYSSGHICTNSIGQNNHPMKLNVRIYKFTQID